MQPLFSKYFFRKCIGVHGGQNKLAQADKYNKEYIFVPNYMDANSDILLVKNTNKSAKAIASHSSNRVRAQNQQANTNTSSTRKYYL